MHVYGKPSELINIEPFSVSDDCQISKKIALIYLKHKNLRKTHKVPKKTPKEQLTFNSLKPHETKVYQLYMKRKRYMEKAIEMLGVLV